MCGGKVVYSILHLTKLYQRERFQCKARFHSAISMDEEVCTLYNRVACEHIILSQQVYVMYTFR